MAKKYDHKNFLKIKKGRNWCTYGLSEYAQPEWFKKWKWDKLNLPAIYLENWLDCGERHIDRTAGWAIHGLGIQTELPKNEFTALHFLAGPFVAHYPQLSTPHVQVQLIKKNYQKFINQ